MFLQPVALGLELVALLRKALLLHLKLAPELDESLLLLLHRAFSSASWFEASSSSCRYFSLALTFSMFCSCNTSLDSIAVWR